MLMLVDMYLVVAEQLVSEMMKPDTIY